MSKEQQHEGHEDHEDHEDRASGDAGLPEADDVAPETIEQLEEERAQRLDPDNRPDGVEVDNTVRTFDPGAGRFTDDPDYDPQDQTFAAGESET